MNIHKLMELGNKQAQKRVKMSMDKKFSRGLKYLNTKIGLWRNVETQFVILEHEIWHGINFRILKNN